MPKFSVVTNKYFREVILDEIKEYNRKEGNEDEISDWNSIFDKIQKEDRKYNKSHKEHKN